MGVEVHFEPATYAHAEALAPLMRAEDVAELQACGMDSPLEGLRMAIDASDAAFAMLFDGEVGALFGVAPQVAPTALGASDVSVAWILTGRAVSRHPVAFARRSHAMLRALFQRGGDELFNLVDARYTASLRWLRWLGFTVYPPAPFGPYGLPFHHVFIERSAWAG